MSKVLWCMVVVVLVIMGVGICDISSFVASKYEESKFVSNSEMAVFSETVKGELVIESVPGKVSCEEQIRNGVGTDSCVSIGNVNFGKMVIVQPKVVKQVEVVVD